ncbi:unnamed protein product [Cladocopium goreaui]|uniref:CCHC-type domain-containing protein n=1 Tax=Cladocopium goreaui TaxID=2562237 RepID=A0A9P1D886_9DINO|nr:unnamed protein product [Cladocopium goreaui]
MDSFILDVLRGWRLLVAASLSPEEWRDVLATTGNKLDYLSVSSALQTLWDEQLGGNGKWHSNVSSASLSSFWHEGSWPYDAWSDNQAMWHDWNESEDWPSEAWEAAAATGEQPGPSDERVDDVTDPTLIEALEAEKQAESLALEARRTWSQAQQATQQLRRDRGFGKSGSGSSSSNPIRCYLCGGPHLQKDCPDKHHPSFRKGYGKSLSQAELDAYLAGKSKGKGFKGKFKDGMFAWHDDGSWYSDSFMINKGKGKNPKGKYFKPSANVYGMDFYALEMMDVEDSPQTFHVFPLELFSTDESNNKRSTPPGYGMLDCGATASAGPEASAKRLISKLRLFDPDLKVCFNYNKRPYFRYGSGKWGQALYHAVIHSSWDSSRCFELYVLENPMEYNSEWFSDDMLVPILVGMDHLKKTGLILDFSDGHAVNGNDNPAVPYVMERNLKGHYMVNIAYYLFGSLSDSEVGGNEPFAAQLLEQDCHLVMLKVIYMSVKFHQLVVKLSSILLCNDAVNRTRIPNMQPVIFKFPKYLLVTRLHMSRKPPAPLDHSREIVVDPRDIRSQTTSWPCFGKHVSSNPKSNGYGQWRTCEICGVRLSYVPREGYQGKSAAQACHKTVELAMKQLRQDLEPCGRFPTMDLVETMIQIITDESKIVATESTLKRLKSHVDTLKQTYADQMKSDTQAPKGSSTSPTDVWRFLSEQEKSKLMEIAMERHKEEELMKSDPELELVPASAGNKTATLAFLGMMTLAARTGLRDFLQGGFMQKAWSIGTTSSHFYHLYRSKTCPGCHEHDRIQGLETQKSAYYPWKLCKSIAQTWRQELYPDKWLTYLQAPLPSFVEPEEQLQALGLMDGALDFCPAMDLCPGLDFYPAESSSSSEPSGKELSLWRVHLMKYHRAAGHPSNYNLSRILRDAGRAPWQVRAAMDLQCDECAALKLGGSSSGKVPPASMRPMPRAWECVGMDCTEWTPLQSQVKYYVLVIMDLATKFKVTRILMQCGLNEQKTETTDQILDAFSQLWLQDKPKPMFLIPDNAMSMTSRKMREALSDFNITLDPPAPKESWAHGLLERANQEIKEVASKVKLNNPDLQPSTCLALATHALNSTAYVQGYTPFQWVYGSQPTLTDEDIVSLSYAPSDPPGLDYAALLKKRREAEEVARKERLDFELHSGENPAAWKSLASFIPQRSFVDVVPEEPQEEDEDLPQLPDEPNQLPRLSKPAYRHTFKHAPKKVTFAEPSQPPEPVNAYDPSFAANPDEDDEAIGNAGIGSGIPTLEARSGSSKAKLLDSTDGQISEPETKRPRTDDDDALLLSYLEQVDELYVLEFDMVLENDRQKRKLVYNPSLFLAQKMRDCEVRLEKLSPAHRELFRRAKLKEVQLLSFLMLLLGPIS